MAPKTIATGLLALTALSSAAPNQADRLVESTTKTLFLPTTTNKNDYNNNVWASVITQAPSATEYLVACETAFSQPDQCDGPWTGVTLTQGPSTMGVEVGGATYRCEFDDDDDDDEAVCGVKKGEEEEEASMKLTGTAVTIVTDAIAAPELRSVVGGTVNMAKGGSSGGGGGRGGGGGGGKRPGVVGGGGSSHNDDDTEEENNSDYDDDDDSSSSSSSNDVDDDKDDSSSSSNDVDDDKDDSSSSSSSSPNNVHNKDDDDDQYMEVDDIDDLAGSADVRTPASVLAFAAALGAMAVLV